MTRRRTAADPTAHRRRLRRLALLLTGGAVLGAALAVPVAPAGADDLGFPYRTDFDTAAGGTLTGDAHIEDGWLRLTDTGKSEAGAWSMDDAFPSSLGLEIEFRYAVHGGDGADGFALSLSDGAEPSGVGRPGAALGYACHGLAGAEGPCVDDGLPGAFAGVGFDEYGNFSSAINDSGPGRAPEHLAVRGSGDGVDGYRFLRNVAMPQGVSTGGREQGRIVHVTIQPDESGTLGMTVRVADRDTGELRTLLDRVPLDGPDQAVIPPTLRLGFSASTGSHTNVHEIDRLAVSVPTDLRVEQSPIPAVAGSEVSYSVTSSNRGRNASTASALEVLVPPELHDVTWTCTAGTGGTCGTDSGALDDGVLRTTAALQRGGSVVHEIRGTLVPDAAGTLESTATIRPEPSLGDTDETDNVSRVRATVSRHADLTTGKAVALVDGAESLAPGQDVEYTVTARNGGPSVAHAVGVRDDLPSALAFAGSVDGCAVDGQRVTCASEDDLDPGGERSFRFRATLDPDYRGDGSDVVNVAVATSPTDPDDGDPSPGVELPTVTIPGDGGPGEGDTGGGGTEAGIGGPGSAAVPSRAPSTAANGTKALAFTGSRGVLALAGVGAGAAVLGLVARRIAPRVGARTAPSGVDGD